MNINKLPILHNFSNPLRILTFGMIILSSVILVLIFGIVIAVPFFGQDVMEKLALMGNSNDPEIISMAKYFQIVSQVGTFLLPAFLFAYLDGRKTLSYLKLNVMPELRTMIAACITILAAVPLINFLSELNQQMSLPSSMADIEHWMRSSEDNASQMTETFLNVTTTGGFLINLLMIAIIPAVGEELLFRGVLQKLFSQWTKNVHVAVILAAFLFSAIHFQFYGFIPRFLMGVLLGYTFVWSGSLWVPILIHFTNNFSAVIVSCFYNSGKAVNPFDTIGTGETALVPVLISITATTVLIYLLFYFEKQKHLKTSELHK